MFLEYISKSVSKTTGLQQVGKFPSFPILTILHSILQHTSWQAFLPLLILSVCLSHQTGYSALPVLKLFLKRRQILCIPTDFPAKYHHKVRRQMQREGSAVMHACQDRLLMSSLLACSPTQSSGQVRSVGVGDVSSGDGL